MKKKTPSWQRQLTQNITVKGILQRFPDAAARLKLTPDKLTAINRTYPINITQHYASLIDQKDVNDPLLRIVFPNPLELAGAGMPDQSGERFNTCTTGIDGLQHKYGPTALILITGTCASYCRFCFRRRFVGTNTETISDLEDALDYISSRKEITNVLLSGGDAFMMSNKRIAHILQRLSEIDHVGMIRFGSKMPVYLPSRFKDPELLDILREHNHPGKHIYVVTHVDHPRELASESVIAHRNLANAGISLLSQTVLMRGVNDDPKILSELFRALTRIGVRPYYVFQCRPVKGGIHFQVPLLDAFGIFEKAKKSVSGPAKTARFALSHVSGKIEVVSVEQDGLSRRAIFKYHQCRDPKHIGRIMVLSYKEPSHWLDDIFGQPHNILTGSGVVAFAKEQIRLLSTA